ncbi:MAG: ammonia-forming cytochrome c nitrite reductase subunit c552 [Actinobacteria bacterium]|nr:ammonia-forming cytochrome c nitrite reductase subunit c552 [Actinomycetota bacterium]
MKSNKKAVVTLGCIVVVFSLVALACAKQPQSTEQPQQESLTVNGVEIIPDDQVVSDDQIVFAADWATIYPDEYATYLLNDVTSYDYAGAPATTDYLEAYPAIKTLYNGGGFAKEFNKPIGHINSLETVFSTARTKKGSSCLSCKTPQYILMEREGGTAFYSTPFEESFAKVTEPISCYDCHENQPGIIHVNRTNITNAIEEYSIEIEEKILVCAQCHNDYYMDPETGAVINPYKYGTDPESMLKYYNEIDFVDFTNPDSGTPLLKVQHPEWETFSASLHASQGLTCPDCHMAKEDGYTSHIWTTPFKSETIMNDVCLGCHTELTVQELEDRVNGLQDETQARVTDISEQIAALNGKIAENKDTMDTATLEKVRSLHRDAQFYWDFVFSENSDGYHNSALAEECLDTSQAVIDEANALF